MAQYHAHEILAKENDGWGCKYYTCTPDAPEYGKKAELAQMYLGEYAAGRLKCWKIVTTEVSQDIYRCEVGLDAGPSSTTECGAFVCGRCGCRKQNCSC